MTIIGTVCGVAVWLLPIAALGVGAATLYAVASIALGKRERRLWDRRLR